jgi:hypothetical protein
VRVSAPAFRARRPDNNLGRIMGKRILFVSAAFLALAACQPAGTDPVLTGAAAGAVLGAVVDDDNRAQGAMVGAALGAAAGGIAGAAQQGPQCRYRYPDGRVEVRACP